MGKLVLRVVINAIALFVAAWVLGPERMQLTEDIGGLIIVAIVFGLVNAFIKPIVSILSCPLTIITLGLFTLVINALMLMLTGWLTGGVSTAGFWWALVASVIISIVSTLLSWFLVDDES